MALRKLHGRGPMPRPQAIQIIRESGFEIIKKPNGIPNNYKVCLADSGGGMIYQDPLNIHNTIRVMPPNPKGFSCQRVPYVVERRDSQLIDKYGNFINSSGIAYKKKDEAIHIPLSEYVYRK